MTETPLDLAHAAMMGAPDDDGLRLRFLERLGDAELFLLLEAEAEGDQITPRVFPLDDMSVVAVFDTPDRLAAFVGGSAPYAAMSGRVVAGLLASEALGLALNLDVAPSTFLLAPDGVVWLAQTMALVPEEVQAQVEEVSPPHAISEQLLSALSTKLSTGAGLAECAYLVQTQMAGEGQKYLLGVINCRPGAEAALAKAVTETIAFSDLDGMQMDVGFFGDDDPFAQTLARVGLRIDLPEAAAPTRVAPAAPGRDPAHPPKLK